MIYNVFIHCISRQISPKNTAQCPGVAVTAGPGTWRGGANIYTQMLSNLRQAGICQRGHL